MVKSLSFIRSSLIALSFILSSTASAAGFFTVEEIGQAAAKVSQSIEAFSKDVTQRNYQQLDRDLYVFQRQIELSAKALDHEAGGAATKKAVAAGRAIAQFGTDISERLFILREERESEIKRAGLDQQVEDLMTNKVEYPLLQLAFMGLRHKVDEKSVDGKVGTWDIIRRAAMEIGRDFVGIFWGGDQYIPMSARNKVTGEWYYEPIQAWRRERFSIDLTKIYGPHAERMVPKYNTLHDNDTTYNRENHEERLGGLLLWLTDRAVNIRVERDSAQRYARFTYLMSGLVISQVGLNFLENSYTAVGETSAIILASASALYLLKGATASMRSTRAWFNFNKEVRSEMKKTLTESTEVFLKSKFPRDYYPAQVPGWIRREMAIQKVWQEMKAKLFKRGSAPSQTARAEVGGSKMCKTHFPM